MRQARIAFSFLAVFAVAGCQEDPQPVNQVPGPAPYDDSYATPDPVAIDSGSAQGPTAFDPAGGNTGAAVGVPPVAPAARTYTIQKGDTLWSIANRTYGDGQRWVDIAQANPSLDPAKMAVGQEIVLP